MDTVLEQIADERQRQHDKWGEQNHQEPVWATILGEEYGEACHASLDYYLEASERGSVTGRLIGSLRSELIQVAAVAVAWIECIDRNTGERA